MQEKIAQQEQIIANLKQQVAAYKIRDEIHAAATAGGAFSAEQVHAYLSPKASVVNDKVFIHMGNEKLTPDDAIARLKSQPENANLFNPPAAVDLNNITPEQYRELRKNNPEVLGLQRLR